jgi:hypothetical protein
MRANRADFGYRMAGSTRKGSRFPHTRFMSDALASRKFQLQGYHRLQSGMRGHRKPISTTVPDSGCDLG